MIDASGHQIARRRSATPAGHLSRRAVLLALGCVACTDPGASQAQGAEDDTAFLERLLTGPDPRLPARVRPYRLTRPVTIPAGRTLRIDRGTRIVFHASAISGELVGVLRAGGNRSAIVVDGGEATVECVPPSSGVYAAAARAVTDFTVIGLRGVNCNHVYVDAAPTAWNAYDQVVTSGERANVARRIRIEGGGARFDRRPTVGHGACLLRYAFDWSVTGCTYETAYSGVQWWGGDANPVTGNGMAAAERKCGRFAIVDCSARGTAISGIWGSMGQDGTVSGCRIQDCGDVGFDAEGCTRITFRDCAGQDAANGCFGVFFLNRSIAFMNCHGRATRSDLPLFRVHNPTLDMGNNRHILIRGGRWECTDGSAPGTMDTANGPCAELTIDGATLVNVRIDTAHVGVHLTRIVDNVLTFPQGLRDSSAIRVGGSKTYATPTGLREGTVLVSGNRVQGGRVGATAIELFEDDTISSATATIRDNRIAGAFGTGLRIVNASPNPAVMPASTLTGNVVDLSPSATILTVGATHPGVPAPAVHWLSGRTAAGRPISMRDALRGG